MDSSRAPEQTRPDGRGPAEMRPILLQTDIAPCAPGSVLVTLGRTQVICAAMLEDGVPRWMREQQIEGGWVTAEYSMMPYATSPRTPREISQGRVAGRTMEIQRMIGRALRAVIDLNALGPRTLWIDCDVLCADGGTRTAAISGASVAAVLTLAAAAQQGILPAMPLRETVAAVSVGLVRDQLVLDLCYAEDSVAGVDMNVVMTAGGRLVEVQGGAERAPLSREQFDALLDLAKLGIDTWARHQRDILAARGLEYLFSGR